LCVVPIWVVPDGQAGGPFQEAAQNTRKSPFSTPPLAVMLEMLTVTVDGAVLAPPAGASVRPMKAIGGVGVGVGEGLALSVGVGGVGDEIGELEETGVGVGSAPTAERVTT
jgi:hypothetical protein